MAVGGVARGWDPEFESALLQRGVRRELDSTAAATAARVAPGILASSSLFVLGGDFWDKLRALFLHEARAVFPPAASA